MKELSVFVDESGDLGEYNIHSPYYIVSFVLHDQDIDISDALNHLEYQMTQIGLPRHCIHAGPVIRSENNYKNYSLYERQQILKKLITFTRKTEFKIASVYVDKKGLDSVEIIGKLSKQLSEIINGHLEWFLSYDQIKVYYDNGQVEISKMLSSVFNVLLDNVEFKKVIPSEYRLFQVADLVCTLKLTKLKMDNHTVSKSEKYFFENERTFKKNYLKILEAKLL